VNRKNTRKRSGEESAQTDETPSVLAPQKDKVPVKILTKNSANMFVQTIAKPQAIETFTYQSSGTATSLGSTDQGATAIVETETAFDRDGVAILKRGKSTQDDGLYHGANQYREFIQKREDASGLSKGAGIRAGPVRASSHIRVTARFDYQPDLCKDYKETGYCGYGDACKFMHDRGDYKTGWQLEREWDAQQKQAAEDRLQGNRQAQKQNTEEEDELPFACFICRQPFTNPVVTKCKHYFCEKCALENHIKTKKCFVCNEPTGGIFNMPTKQVLAKLDAKKKQLMEQQEQQQEQGEGGQEGQGEEEG